MEQLAAFLHQYPVLCLFLSILLGHIIGRFHFKGVGLGPVVGTLIAGILISIPVKPEFPESLRWVFFYLFLFSVGYSVGPQFFGSLKKDALPQIALAAIVALSGISTVIGVTAVFRFDEGIAVGLLSGGMTQSAALGTGLSAIAELPIPDDSKAALMANAPLADAITYGFGDLGLLLFLTWLGPKIMRADLKSEAKALEKKLSGGRSEGEVLLGAHYGYRAYRVENARIVHLTIAAVEQRFADARLSIQRVRRGAELLKLDPTLELDQGDCVVVSAQSRGLARATREIGPEIDDAVLLSVPVKTAALVVTNRQLDGKTLEELGLDPRLRGVYLESLQRGTELMPREPWTVVERGDILHIVGAPEGVKLAGEYGGFVEHDLSKTDLTFLAAGVCAGILLGLLKLNAGGVMLGLGTAGSVLVIGLIGGWVRSRYPVFGAIPEPAQRLLMDIGLVVFVAVVGLYAGPHAVEAYHKSGRFLRQDFCGGNGDHDRATRGWDTRGEIPAEDDSSDDPWRTCRCADLYPRPDCTKRG